MVSEDSSFGSSALAGSRKDMPARTVETNNKENRKSPPRIECLPQCFFVDGMLDGIGRLCQG
jgi:hypothetical protein